MEQEEASQDNQEDLGDEPLKKKRLCKIWGCGKLDKGRGYCKLVRTTPICSVTGRIDENSRLYYGPACGIFLYIPRLDR